MVNNEENNFMVVLVEADSSPVIPWDFYKSARGYGKEGRETPLKGPVSKKAEKAMANLNEKFCSSRTQTFICAYSLQSVEQVG